MDYLDEEVLEAKRKMEHQKHTSLETGIYVEEELITFTRKRIPDTNVFLPLPDQFIVMPESVKSVKYPSVNAPAFIVTSLDSTVNFCFNILPVLLEDGEIKNMCSQFQNALGNINRTIKIKNETNIKTDQGNEMIWFEYKGDHLDGQSYNRVCLIRLRKSVLHGVFSCSIKDSKGWIKIIEQVFLAVEEEV